MEEELNKTARHRDSLLASNAELTKQCETIKENMKNALAEIGSSSDERGKKRALEKMNGQLSNLERSIQSSQKDRNIREEPSL